MIQYRFVTLMCKTASGPGEHAVFSGAHQFLCLVAGAAKTQQQWNVLIITGFKFAWLSCADRRCSNISLPYQVSLLEGSLLALFTLLQW